MTKFHEAVAAVSSATKDKKQAEDWVTALIALGLLKLDPEPLRSHLLNVPCVSSKDGLAVVRADTMIETLRMAGYDVRDCVWRP